MGKVLRTVGILVSGVAIVAAAWFGAPIHQGSLSLVGLLRLGLPVFLYVFAQCWLEEGRARERRVRGLPDPD
ncbi:hypothetical protein [Sorangium sp. So ce1099]|uniref:hypothetical protein n=1 Tax=Sorangium sp. So ce1099 TaxID=3133331 RepID=UPI003F62DFA2